MEGDRITGFRTLPRPTLTRVWRVLTVRVTRWLTSRLGTGLTLSGNPLYLRQKQRVS